MKTVLILFLYFISVANATHLRNREQEIIPENVPCNFTYYYPCGFNGKCENNVCICEKEYATLENIKPCNYNRKSYMTAFLMQLILGPTGISSVYVGQNVIGACKFVSFVVVLFFVFISSFLGKCCGKGEGGILCERPVLFLMFCVFVWWVFDSVFFGVNHYTDENGISLYE